MSNRRTFTDYEKKTIYAKYNGCCALCGKPVKFKELTIDHKVPLSKGGSNGMENLQLTCKGCNSTKSDLTEIEFMEKLWELFSYNFFNIIKVHYINFARNEK